MELIVNSIIVACILFLLGIIIKHFGEIDLDYDFKKYIEIMGLLTFIVPIMSSGIVLIWNKSLDASTVAINIQGILILYLSSLLGAIVGDFFTALLILIVNYFGYDL